MRHSFARSAQFVVLAVPLLPAAAPAQDAGPLVERLGAMSAVTGFEGPMADSLAALLPGAARDRAGNVVLVRGEGAPVRIAACPMDEVGWVVGGVTAEGYLTLRRVGSTPVGPLYDQFLEGHRVTVFGRRGAVPGVVGVRSTHLARGRPAGDDPPFPLDNAFLDVGAGSARDVLGLGVEMLAPVTRAKRVHRYGPGLSLAAGPWIGQRAACAALLMAAQRPGGAAGTTIVAFTARRHLGHDGTQFLLHGHPDAELLLVGGLSESEVGGGPRTDTESVGGRRYPAWLLPARYARTPAETVAIADVTALASRLAEWLGGGR